MVFQQLYYVLHLRYLNNMLIWYSVRE